MATTERNAQGVDVLSALANAATFARAYSLPNSASDYEAAHAAVAELVETQRTTLRMLEAAHRGMGMWTDDNPRIVRARAALLPFQSEAES